MVRGTLSGTEVDKVDPATVSSAYSGIKQTFADQAFCPE